MSKEIFNKHASCLNFKQFIKHALVHMLLAFIIIPNNIFSRDSNIRESKATDPVYKSKLFQKHGGITASGGGKSLSSSSSKQDKKDTAKKSESHYGAHEDNIVLCTVCGIKGHVSDVFKHNDYKEKNT